MLAPLLVLQLLAVPPTTANEATIVLGLGDDPRVLKRLDIVRRMSPFGETASARQVQGWLSGIADPSVMTVAEMRAKLDRADELDAEFQIQDAKKLRDEVVAAYSSMPVAEPAAGVQTALAMQDTAAQLVTTNKKKEALAAFVEQQRRFPTVSIDMNKHRPDIVATYEKAAGEIKKLPQQKLTVASTRAGTVMLDGRSLGAIAAGNSQQVTPGSAVGSITAMVPRGRYNVWMSDASGRSFMHPVDVGAMPLAVMVDFDLEQRMVTEPTLFIRCGADCDPVLTRLQKATGVARVIGVRMVSQEASEAVVADATGELKTEPLQTVDEIADPPLVTATAKAGPDHHISPWSVAPFGVAQFMQHRPVVGTVFAAVTAGAIGWNIAAATSKDGPHDNPNRTQQNISAGLVVGAVVGAALEGFLWDWRHPTYP